jgi:hypothetical protein
MNYFFGKSFSSLFLEVTSFLREKSMSWAGHKAINVHLSLLETARPGPKMKPEKKLGNGGGGPAVDLAYPRRPGDADGFIRGDVSLIEKGKKARDDLGTPSFFPEEVATANIVQGRRARGKKAEQCAAAKIDVVKAVAAARIAKAKAEEAGRTAKGRPRRLP